MNFVIVHTGMNEGLLAREKGVMSNIRVPLRQQCEDRIYIRFTLYSVHESYTRRLHFDLLRK